VYQAKLMPKKTDLKNKYFYNCRLARTWYLYNLKIPAMLKPDLNITKEYSYNLTELVQLSNGSNDFVVNMLEIFVRSASEILSQLKSNLLVNNWEKVSELAHKAIPSFHFMGLVNFSEKLRFIEQNASNENEHEKIRELIGFIDKNMVVILNDLKSEIEKYKA